MVNGGDSSKGRDGVGEGIGGKGLKWSLFDDAGRNNLVSAVESEFFPPVDPCAQV